MIEQLETRKIISVQTLGLVEKAVKCTEQVPKEVAIKEKNA